MQRTKIEWTDFTSNPLSYRRKSDGKVVWACVKISPGCANCYAEAIALRYDRGRVFQAANMDELEPFLDAGELHEMLTKKTAGGLGVSGRRCFLGDMTDIAGEWVSDGLLDLLFAVMALRSDVTWQVLTKRPARLRDYLRQLEAEKDMNRWAMAAFDFDSMLPARDVFDAMAWPLPNVWIGTSVESPKYLARVDLLEQIPAAVRFLSVEPLLEDIWLDLGRRRQHLPCPAGIPGCEVLHLGDSLIHWVVVGGESGPGSRPCPVAAVRHLVQQCAAACVPCFVKQLGSRPVSHTEGEVEYRLKLKSYKGNDPSEWPEDLRVRQFPGDI